MAEPIRPNVLGKIIRNIHTVCSCLSWLYTYHQYVVDSCDPFTHILPCCFLLSNSEGYRESTHGVHYSWEVFHLALCVNCWFLWPLSLAWFNCNPRMCICKLQRVGGITYPFPNFTGCTVEVWAWITTILSHFTGYAISYPCLHAMIKIKQC